MIAARPQFLHPVKQLDQATLRMAERKFDAFIKRRRGEITGKRDLKRTVLAWAKRLTPAALVGFILWVLLGEDLPTAAYGWFVEVPKTAARKVASVFKPKWHVLEKS